MIVKVLLDVYKIMLLLILLCKRKFKRAMHISMHAHSPYAYVCVQVCVNV